MSKPVILVTGATGRQGGSTARILLAAGHNVRAFVRDASSPAALELKNQGATLVEGDFFNLPSITAALDGITAVFLNTFPSYTNENAEVRTAETFVSAALQAGVTNLVVSTVFMANTHEDWSVVSDKYFWLAKYFRSKSGVEKVVRNAGFQSYTILRPCWLMHQYEEVRMAKMHFPAWDERTITVSYPPEWRQPHLDAFDVGKFAAAALASSPFSDVYKGKEIDLVSQYLTWDEVAKALGDAVGAEVKVVYRTLEETEALLKSGTAPVLEVQLWNQETKRADVQGLNQYGFELATFAQYLEREKAAIKKSLGVE